MVDRDTTSGSSSPLEAQHPEAYAAARELILAGVPIFTAPPHPLTSNEFKLPSEWQTATPTMDVLDRWREGWALCAVMGHALDLIDLDPRNGSDEGRKVMDALDLWPTRVCQATTPSGGWHVFIPALGAASINWMSQNGKTSGIAPGIDYKGGRADGTGRGFAYIAPTVRKGGTYTWTDAPDHVVISDEAGVYEPLRDHINRDRDAERPTVRQDGADPFDIPARLFTRAQAKAYCAAPYEAFKTMRTPQDHGFNTALNELAVLWGHFVPEFITRTQAAQHIYTAAVTNRSVEFQGQAGVRATIISGLARGMAEPYQRAQEDARIDPEVPEQPDSLAAEFLTATQLQDMPNPEPLINGVLDLDTTAWMIGKAGSYKSFIAIDMLGHVALGKPWHGHDVKQGRGVVIVAEGVRGTKLRVAAFERTYGALGDQVMFLPRPVQARNAGAWQALVEAVATFEPVFVVIDTQSRVTIGLEENSNSEMMTYVQAVDAIRTATQACVLSLHHQGRSGLDARGASSIDGAQDAELRIERDMDRHVLLHLDKMKDADDTEVIDLDLIRSEGGIDTKTGRDLSSLIVVTGSLANRKIVKDWIDNLVPNQAVLVGCFADFVPNVGGTMAQVRRLVTDRLGDHPMANSSFARAWDGLVTKGIIERAGTSQRWVLTSMTD